MKNWKRARNFLPLHLSTLHFHVASLSDINDEFIGAYCSCGLTRGYKHGICNKVGAVAANYLKISVIAPWRQNRPWELRDNAYRWSCERARSGKRGWWFWRRRGEEVNAFRMERKLRGSFRHKSYRAREGKDGAWRKPAATKPGLNSRQRNRHALLSLRDV